MADAAMLIAEGTHSRAMMERLGHTSVTVMLNTYSHLPRWIDASRTEALDRVARAAGSSLSNVSNVVSMLPAGGRH